MKIKTEHKRNIFIVTFLLLCATMGLAVISRASSSDTYIKVGLFYGNESLSSVEMKSAEGFVLMSEKNGELTSLKSLAEYKTLIATIKGDVVVVKDENGTLISNAFAQENFLMSAAKNSEECFLSINGITYRDGVSLLKDATSRITVINKVTVERYIKGVLNAEMSYAYPAEALKAQAVTARSYALANIGKHKKYGFDICASNCCQVYKGVSAEYPETNAACEATKNLIISYGGKIVPGFYYANSGGHTQNSEDVWSSPLGYLRAVKDDFAPFYSWSGQISFDELKTKLDNKGYNPGKIKSVYIGRRYTSGAVAEFVIEGSNEKITLTKENVRTTLGLAAVKSTLFSMGASANPEIKTDSADAVLSLYTSSGPSSIKNTIHIVSGDGQVTETELELITIFDGKNMIELKSLQAQATEFTQETVTSGQVFFSGLGYGHGVGMPQSSAKEMAYKGYNYSDILNFFYTDIKIEPFNGLLD